MKKFFLLLSVCALALSSCSEQEAKQPENSNLLSTSLVNNPRTADGTDATKLQSLATMDFRDTVFDFGTIRQGEVVNHDFEFTNNGKSPLIVSNAAGSCGCTVADFPKEPLPPGKSAIIKVQFSSAGKEGHQEKSVTLTTNSVRGNHFLYIKGEVKK